MSLDFAAIATDIDTVLDRARKLRASSKYNDCSDQPAESVVVVTLLAAAVDRYAPPGSVYRSYGSILPAHVSIRVLPGMLEALRDDYRAGRMRTVTELLHAELFGDFLDMASHLLDENYKDPAAVMAGAVLEEHLRKLAVKYQVSNTDAHGKPKKASTLNADLKKAGAYGGSDEKSVTAWLDIRNDAAHGHYTKYANQQVALLIGGIRDLVTRVPA